MSSQIELVQIVELLGDPGHVELHAIRTAGADKRLVVVTTSKAKDPRSYRAVLLAELAELDARLAAEAAAARDAAAE